jgi:hypothetical protein
MNESSALPEEMAALIRIYFGRDTQHHGKRLEAAAILFSEFAKRNINLAKSMDMQTELNWVALLYLATDPFEELCYQDTGDGATLLNTRGPVLSIEKALLALKKGLDLCRDAATSKTPSDEINVSADFLSSLICDSQIRGTRSTRHFKDESTNFYMFEQEISCLIDRVLSNANECLNKGKIKPKARPKNECYSAFIKNLAKIARHCGISERNGSGRLNSEFVTLVASCEVILPRDLRGHDQRTIQRRIASALNRESAK